MYDQLTDRNYQRLAELLQGHVGIRLPPTKRTMVEGRPRKRVRALGFDDLDTYCRSLFDHGTLESEFVHLIDAVTTNKTDFFREPDHFDYLAENAVPALLVAKPGSRPRTLKLWSAACSIGAEPYTIAMVMEELGQRYRGLDYAILGTDISTDVLQQAVTAVYPEEMVDPVPPGMRQRFLMRSRNPERRQVRIVPELRRRVRFLRMNLMDASYPVERDVDVIFCRNVLIYFDRPTQNAVLERLCSHLGPGGYLFLGHAESAAGGALDSMKQAAPTILRRR
jgi:chemotaxis protein methyltransferase CheR